MSVYAFPRPGPPGRRMAGRRPVFTWPVHVPGRGTFKARFKVLSTDHWRDLSAHVPPDQVGIVFLREALAGWRGIVARDGSPLEFSAEARERLLADGEVRAALMTAFAELVRHVSTRPPPDGGGLAIAA